MDLNRGDTTVNLNDDQESEWRSANEAARSESLTSVSGDLALNDEAASSPDENPGDQWEEEENINHINVFAPSQPDVADQEEQPPYTYQAQQRYQQEQQEDTYPTNTAAGEQLDQEPYQLPSPPTAAEQGLSRPSGASLFSVPPSSAPHSGVYDMPLEAFEFRDLDSGKTFQLDKRYWIKDVDTGKVYVLEPDENEEQGGGGGGGDRVGSAGGRSTPGTTSSVRVSDLISGQELTLEEFENTLGYFREPPALHSVSQESLNGDDDEDEERDLAAHAQMLAQRGLHSLSLAASSSANWIKVKAAAAKERMSSSRDHHQTDDTSPGSGHFGASPRSLGDSSPTSIASSMRASDGQGLPVKVNVSKKPFKELTDLRLVQTVAAHQGVVWTMRFSKSGRYLATAGQDCVIAVWEVVLHRERERSGVELGPSGINTLETGVAGGGGHPSSAPDSPLGSDATANTAGTLSNSPSGSVYGVPVLRSRPVRLYRGHKQDILDLAWSRTNFLLSASMDKTVRLWHVSMDECLRVFKHTDFVTAIDFHPSDDKLFVSGSIDGKVRLWNVPEQRVVSWQDVHDMVTAVSYSRDGRRAVVGTMRGKCRFYGVSSKGTLEYEAQVDVKNKRGQHARGKKVTGLYFAPSAASSSSSSSGSAGGAGASSKGGGSGSTTGRISTSHGASTSSIGGGGGGGVSSAAATAAAAAAASCGSLLITSNDSRVRLYDGYTLRSKYKGHSNKSTQIKASFSPKGDYVICGSDDGLAYIWSTRKTAVPGSPERNVNSSSNIFRNTSTSGNTTSGGGGGGGGQVEQISPLIRPGSATTTATTTPAITVAAGPMTDPVAKEKNASFESFRISNDVITVVLFGPECTHRPLDNFSPTALAAAEEAAATATGGGRALEQSVVGSGSASANVSLGGATAARGQIILAAGYGGEIKVYENIGLPQWL